jgi:hypothetical protein
MNSRTLPLFDNISPPAPNHISSQGRAQDSAQFCTVRMDETEMQACDNRSKEVRCLLQRLLPVASSSRNCSRRQRHPNLPLSERTPLQQIIDRNSPTGLTASTEAESACARIIARQFIRSRGTCAVNSSPDPIFCHPSNNPLTVRIAIFGGLNEILNGYSHIELLTT